MCVDDGWGAGRRPTRWRVLLRGPGCFVCPWAAARPRAVRAASFARRVASKPGQAPPPPTGTAAGLCGALHASGAGSLLSGSARRLEARPGPATAHVHRSLARVLQLPVPSGPSGALHTSGARSADVCLYLVSKSGIGCQSAILHVIPVSLFQLLNLCRWNCNVFVRSQKMTEINYVRHLSGACLTVARGAPQLGLPIPPHRQQWGGVCAMRSLLAVSRRRVGALHGVIPPDWWR